VAAPENAGVLARLPVTIAHDIGAEAVFRQRTVTRQPLGISTRTCPRE
jgi:hypothetical protein